MIQAPALRELQYSCEDAVIIITPLLKSEVVYRRFVGVSGWLCSDTGLSMGLRAGWCAVLVEAMSDESIARSCFDRAQ